MKTTQMTPFFHLLFLLYLLVTFISEFENTLNSFSNSLLWSILVCKIPQFLQKLLIWTAHQTFPESRHPEVTKNLYYVLFTRWSKIPIFQDPAHGLYWRLNRISYRACLIFITFLVTKKQLLRAFLICTFICLLLNSFDLRRYSSNSSKIYTFIRLLCCSCV